jgi:hypothetical protein
MGRGSYFLIIIAVLLVGAVFLRPHPPAPAPIGPIEVPHYKPKAVAGRVKTGAMIRPQVAPLKRVVPSPAEAPAQPATIETEEQKRDRLARIIASPEFLKKALDFERAAKFPVFKDEDVVEDHNTETSYFKKYKIKNREFYVGGDAGRYMEAVVNSKGEQIFLHGFQEGRLRQLQVQMAVDNGGPKGLHSFLFDQNGSVAMISSEVDGQTFNLKFENGQLSERTYLRDNEEEETVETVRF